MDEEIIQRIIYIILGIIFFIIFSTKKKTPQKQTTAQTVPNSTKTNENKDVFKPVKELKKQPSKNETKYETLENQSLEVENYSEIANLEEVELSEIKENFLTNRRTISKNKEKHFLNEKTEEPSFTVTSDELKKAVILSDIIQPKYF